MITTRAKIYRAIFLALLSATLVFPYHQRAAAAAEPEPELICDPLPADPNQIILCNYFDLLNPRGRTYEPGEDPAHPIKLPGISGTWGMSGAYNPDTDKLVIAATTQQAQDRRPMVVMVVNAKTFEIEKGPIKVSQDPNDSHAGAPKIVYNPDQKNFLALWEDSRSGDNKRHTYGRFISGAGEPVGHDFPVVNYANPMLADLEYNWKEQKFVALFDGTDRAFLKTVDAEGNVGPEIVVSRAAGAAYEGQVRFDINPHLNQYWVAAISCTAPDQATEDCDTIVHKIDMATGTAVGKPVIVSRKQIGHNAVAAADLAYSPHDGAAMVAWFSVAQGDLKGPGTFGRTMRDDGTMSDIFEILTPLVFPYSNAYSGPKLSFNPWTNTIFTVSEDDLGGTIMMEFTTSGLPLNIHQAIAPPADEYGRAYGTFNPINFFSRLGDIVMGTYGYQQAVLTQTQSISGYYPGNEEQPTEEEGQVLGIVSGSATERVEEFPKLITKIYVWSLGIAGLLALLMATAGGVAYMTAAGNAERATKGSEMIWGAVIGLALLFGAYLLLNTINPNLVNFDVKSITDLITRVPPKVTMPRLPTAPVPKPTIPSGVKPYSPLEVEELIAKYSKEFGVDPKIPSAIAGCESRNSWSARNPLPQSSASGVFQFVRKTWAGTPEGKGGKSVFDADANVRAAVRIIKERGTADWNASRGCWGGRI